MLKKTPPTHIPKWYIKIDESSLSSDIVTLQMVVTSIKNLITYLITL